MLALNQIISMNKYTTATLPKAVSYTDNLHSVACFFFIFQKVVCIPANTELYWIIHLPQAFQVSEQGPLRNFQPTT